jgi:hypothetical protein
MLQLHEIYILVLSSDYNELNFKLNSILTCISNWFQKNQLILNQNKTTVVKFIPSQSHTYPLSTTYNDQLLKVAESIRFLGLQLESHLNGKLHSEELSKKLPSVCYMRKLSYTLNLKTLRMVYFAYIHSIVSYGIIFGGSSASM